MKRTGTGLVVVTVAVCMLLSVGVASKSFAQILWVASIDARMGYLPVYAEPSENSSIVGSLQRCTRVLLTGAGKGPLVEISQPMQGWVQADLLGENSCSAGYVEPEEPTVIGTAPVGRIYGPYFHHRHHRHHYKHHFAHHHGGHLAAGHHGHHSRHH
ncbi:MAG: hypothetical protein ACLQPD_07500 [Desulfomonilaceae bacterium]